MTAPFDPKDYNELVVTESPIPGLFVIELPVHGDNRGWFKENYNRAKMEQLGLPHFEIVQNNYSFNVEKGVTRGLHAEPWNKYISLANGRAFCAWVDVRKGDSFGTTFSVELTPGRAVFVPRGVANGYQTLEENMIYTYLVDAHWSPDAQYTMVNAFDPELHIEWPFDKAAAIRSDKDIAHPLISEITPVEV